MERKMQGKIRLFLAAACLLFFAYIMLHHGLIGDAPVKWSAETEKELCLPAICPADHNVKKNYSIRGEEEFEGDGFYPSFEDSFLLLFSFSGLADFGRNGKSFYACLRSCFTVAAGILGIIRIIHEMDGKKKGFAKG